MDTVILEWLESNRDYALWLVPLLAFGEACVGLGLFVSGFLLVTAATLLYTGEYATLAQIIPLAWAGALLGDHSGFLVGAQIGPRFHHLRLAQRYRQALLKSEALVQRHGDDLQFVLIDTARLQATAMGTAIKQRLADLTRALHKLHWEGRKQFLQMYLGMTGRRLSWQFLWPFYLYDLKV